MSGFIENAVEGAFGLTMERVRQQLDYGYEDQRPGLDPKQQKEFLAEQGQGKTDEAYHQCLAYHGFTWWPLERLAMLPTKTLKTEGEWRNDRLKLAYTPNDLTTSFPAGPEQLDRFLRDKNMVNAVTQRRASKSDLKKARSRK